MRCLIVSGHPLKHSLSQQLVRLCATKLRDEGHVVVIEDLYDQGFDPVMKADERASYYEVNDSLFEISQYTQRLQNAEVVLMVFPMWWFGPPAILKGWIDRVWAPGVAFESHSKGFLPKLKKLRKVILINTFNFSRDVDESLNFPFTEIVRNVLLNKSAPDAELVELMLYECSTLNEAKYKAFTSMVHAELQSL